MGLYDNLMSAFSVPTKQIQQGYKSQLGGISQAGQAAPTGAGQATNTLQDYLKQALGQLQGGTQQAAGYLGQATPLWQQLFGQGEQGLTQLGKLLGLGGGSPADIEATLAATPGYQFTKEQGLDALTRSANARGMLTSGNTSQDIMKYVTGLADQTYQQAVSNLQPYMGLAENAASGLTGNLTNLSNLYSGLGAKEAGLTAGTGGDIAGLQSNLGQYLANLGLLKGQAGYQRAQNVAGAQQGAGSNLWNALLGLGGLGANIYGSYGVA